MFTSRSRSNLIGSHDFPCLRHPLQIRLIFRHSYRLFVICRGVRKEIVHFIPSVTPLLSICAENGRGKFLE